MFLRNLNLKTIYRGQLITQFVLMPILLTWRISQGNTSNFLLSIILIAINLLGIFQTFKQASGLINKIISWLQLLAQPLIIQFTLVSTLATFPDFNALLLPLALIYHSLALIPTVYELALPRLQSLGSKIILILYWGNLYVAASRNLAINLPANGFIYHFLTSGVCGSLVMLCLFILMMKAWTLPLPDWKSRGKQQLTTLAMMAVFCLYLLLFNSFNTGDSWVNMLIAFESRPLNLTWEFFFTGFQAGLLEETMVRYLILLSMLASFSVSKPVRIRILQAIFLSSLIFGAIHITNLLRGQGLANTSLQVLAATAIGIPFALIYLYTGRLSLTILYHAVWDIASFSVSSSTLMSEKVDTAAFMYTAYLFLLIALFSTYMLTGKRMAVIETNVKGLLDQREEQLARQNRSSS
ncbi:CPBP family intramembrane glutamic endopeptidase [Streptococcus dentasini]